MVSLETWLVVFGRVAPVVALHPVFGGRAVPYTVVAGVAAALSGAVAANAVGVEAPAGLARLAGRFAAEVGLGASIGLLGRAVFAAIETAGRVVDECRGAGAAQHYVPQTETSPSPLGQAELHLACAAFWASGAHAALIGALAASFEAIPSATAVVVGDDSRAASLELGLSIAGDLARTAMALAGPAAVACVVVDLLFGLVNRSAPQANVFFLSLPARLLAAVFVTALSTPARSDVWLDLWTRERHWIGELLGAISGG